MRANLTDIQNTSATQKQSFEEDSPTTGTDTFLFPSLIGAIKTFTGSLSIFYNLTFGLVLKKLGLGTGTGLIVLSSISAIIMINMVLLAWSVYKAGK